MAFIRSFVLYLLAALVLMTMAFYNGYPIHDWDTHAYIHFGFLDPTSCIDRSPVYGFFIRLTSLWTSLWFTVFCQCLIVSYLLIRYARLLSPGLQRNNLIIAFVAIITSFTSVSWFCDVLSPHIFSGMLLLTILLYFFDKKAPILHRGIYIFILALTISVHNSHFLIVVCLSLLLLVYALIKKYKVLLKKTLVLILLSLLFYFSMSITNYYNGRGFVFSPASQLFIVARLATDGVLKRYLDDNCNKKKLRLCAVKDQLPIYPWDFMWAPPQSAISKLGVWDTCTPEFTGIISDVFTTPKYLSMYAEKSVTSTFQQLCGIQIGRPAGKDERVIKYFDDEYDQFEASRQNIGKLDMGYFDVFLVLFFVSTSLVVLLLYSRIANKESTQIYCCIITFFIINALVTSSVSVVIGTYQCRIFWILPATNVLLILKYLQAKYGSQFDPNITN